MNKCQICTKPLGSLIYTCCSKLYCYKCIKRCPICGRAPRILPSSTRQKSQTLNRYYQICSSCKKERSLTLYQYFHQPKHNYDFCYVCLTDLYKRYFRSLEQIANQSGIRPQFPFQLLCGCQVTEKQILIFLQKSCYCCNIKIEQNPSYRLNNNLRVMKKCMEILQSKSKLSIYGLDRQKFQKLDQMVLKCEGCDSPLDQILPNQQNLNVCRQCVQLNKLSVKIHEKERQQQRSAKKPAQNTVMQIKLQKLQKKANQGSSSKKNGLKIMKEQEINLSKKIDQPQEQKVVIIQLDNVLEGKAIPQVIEQPNPVFLENVVEPRVMDLENQVLQNLNECKNCSVLLLKQGFLFHRLEQAVQKIQVKDKNSMQNGVQRQNICKLCYFQGKCKQKMAERQKKIEQKIDRMRMYNSTHKTQKRVEKNHNNTNNIFARFDNYKEPSQLTKKLQPSKPNSDKKPNFFQTTTNYVTSSNNFLSQRCTKCSQILKTQLQKKFKICRDCESQGLEKQNKAKKVLKTFQITCNKCKQKKTLKENEVSSLGYCKQCWLSIFGNK